MNLKLVTWNMAFWTHKKSNEEAWKYLIDEVNADIALVQESKPPQNLKNDPNFLWFEIGGTRNWGNGIYSKKYPIRYIPISCKYSGSLVVGEARITETVQLTIISLYGVLEYFGGTSYAISSLHRMLSDLTGILNGHLGGKRNIILGGDLNASRQCDNKNNKANDIFFQRLDDFKLENCFRPPFFLSEYVQTQRYPGSPEPWQNDYFFISKSMSENLKSCTVIDNEKVRKFSDHNPVLIELEL